MLNSEKFAKVSNLEHIPAVQGLSDAMAATLSGGRFYTGGDDPDVILYDNANFGGDNLRINATTGDGDDNLDNKFGGIGPYDFSDKTSSIQIKRGKWMFFTGEGFTGDIRTLNPNDYATPQIFRLPDNSITGIRRIG